MDIRQTNGRIHFTNVPDFNLKYTLECGQCFRWTSHGNKYSGIVGGRLIDISQKEFSLTVEAQPSNNCKEDVIKYFDLNSPLDKIIDKFPCDEIVEKAVKRFHGIRILRQDPWETIASYIVSTNKRIAHIAQIIENLSSAHGEKIEWRGGAGDKDRYSFPDVGAIARSDISALKKCKMGFRAEYLSKSSRMIADGKIKLDKIAKMDTGEAVESLQKLPGVGPKVANCIMLFGFGRFDAFPIDVWIKRAIEKFYFKGKTIPEKKLMKFAKDYFGPYRGYLQEYLYYYARTNLGGARGK